MRIAMIAAMANNRVIGKNNQMPWHLPADLKHFKKVTLGKPVIMGRKTYQSIGQALPGRRNIVISRQSGALSADADWVQSIEQALALVQHEAEVMIIGGAEIYRQVLPLADTLYITEIDLTVEGDAFFPDYLAEASWYQSESEQHQPDSKNLYSYRFRTLNRE
ncbi:MAG: type 3 dihydrofolate reductase [Gammaproteobacteria bacterium]|nr:type 3 dihydrofolate reductase [Gammaproteobacteria bacterium]MBU2056972.1 type 3 dihydrofolate reductase [Gammaproteobacteria bacterium]MBU2174496.1 type 3 dihydrofolate reductase [Gammaproteobacteria bacterium]MBU2248188.1 type 3 dihydrofolate reductase [Gammaproteobacteria bacterium]MBU2344087.1 type 3 dihydrofolate reductase [Gammaproteobacteria bacterium]